MVMMVVMMMMAVYYYYHLRMRHNWHCQRCREAEGQDKDEQELFHG